MKTNINKYLGLHLNALLFGNNSAWGHVPDPPEPPEPSEEYDSLEVGDWVRCKDRDDMLNTMHDLIMEGIETDFRYERHGQKGLWLEVIKVGN